MIEVKGLTRYYGDFAALDDVSFRIEDKQVIGLLGLNGAGKSTTMKILAGLIVPSKGSVVINGQDISTADDSFKKTIGFLPESPPLYNDMTVSDFLRYVARLRGVDPATTDRRLREVIELAALQGREDQIIGTLSHGYRKRVGIAQAVIHEPQLVILDEPISGLDPVQIKEMRSVIRRLGQTQIVLVSSHILTEISQTCDRIIVLNQGKLVAEGTEKELQAKRNTLRLLLTVRDPSSQLDDWLSNNNAVESHTNIDSSPPLTTARIQLKADERELFVVNLLAAGFGLRVLQEDSDDLEDFFLLLTRQGASE